MAETSIASIIEIDKDARSKNVAAKTEAEKILSDAQNRKKQISEDYTRQIIERIKKMSSEFDTMSEEDIKIINDQKQQKLNWLEKQFSKNSSKWSKIILKRITNGKIVL